MILGDRVDADRPPDADRLSLYDALYAKQGSAR
jgi:hypothetical protein